MRSPFAKNKSKLSVQGKLIAAALVLLDVLEEKLEAQAAGQRLRHEVGLQWSFITCLQYLSGKEALGALDALPSQWSYDGRTKADLVRAVTAAALAVANVRPDGVMLCASEFAEHLQGLDFSSSPSDASEHGA